MTLGAVPYTRAAETCQAYGSIYPKPLGPATSQLFLLLARVDRRLALEFWEALPVLPGAHAHSGLEA